MEQRKFSRVPFRVTADVASASGRFAASVANLSMRGVLLVTTGRPPIGERVALRIVLAGQDPDHHLTVDGQVIRHEPDGIAVFLDGYDLETFTLLRRIIAYNLGSCEREAEELARSFAR